MGNYTNNDIGKMLEKLLKVQEQKDWVCEEKFSEATGLKSVEQLRYFRKKNPTLVRVRAQGSVDTLDRTVNRGFLYNLTGWYELHKPIGAIESHPL